jgi:hypothetical protein
LTENLRQHDSIVDSVKKCPICGSEFEKGNISSIRGIRWNKKKPNGFWIEGELLQADPAFTRTSYCALRCSKCKMIMFDYESFVSER